MDINGFVFKKVDAMSGRELFCVERLRSEVFVTEQKITLPELDDDDLRAVQVFKLNDQQTDALATCRLFASSGRWMIGRVAVAKAKRDRGLGQRMMQAAQAYLRRRGIDRLHCHAQLQAKPFYAALGWQAVGQPFDEGGVAHVLMEKSI